MIITRVALLTFFMTFLLIIGIDLVLREFDYQWVLDDFWDYRYNPGNVYNILMFLGAIIYAVIADMRIKKNRQKDKSQ